MQVLLTPKYNTQFNLCNNNSRNNFGLRLKPQLTSDVVSFKGKKDLLELSKRDIFSSIDKSLKNEANFIGKGCEGKIYQIEGTKYCVKIPFNYLLNPKADYKSNFSKDISTKDKINHIVARLGDGAVIMNKIEGTPVWKSGMDVKSAKKVVKDVAAFPLTSYKGFLKQIADAHNNGMMFDPFNHNVIVNNKTKSITAIDFIDNLGVSFEELNPMQMMFGSLLNQESTKKQKDIIAKKILTVSLDEFKPNYNPFLDIGQFDLLEFTDMLSRHDICNFDKSLDDNLLNIVNLKDKELEGGRCKKALSDLVNKTKDIINT